MRKSRFKDNNDLFIEEVKACHKSELDNLSYEKTKFVTYKEKVTVTCHTKDENGEEHGDFTIKPCHLLSGEGCPKCRYLKTGRRLQKSLKQIIEDARAVHGDLYDYSLITEYKNLGTKYPIRCKKHGVFYQTFLNHIHGEQGCPICGLEKSGENRRMTFDEFKEKASKGHNNKYEYDEESFNNRFSKDDRKIKIICPTHGEFWQTTTNHLFGQGCPICKESKLEISMASSLEAANIEYERYKRFDWLGRQTLDFYIPKYNIGIECQGKQHFLENCGWGRTPETLEEIKGRDDIKKKLCDEHGVRILYYSNLGIDYPYHVYESKDELIAEIVKSDMSIAEEASGNGGE